MPLPRSPGNHQPDALKLQHRFARYRATVGLGGRIPRDRLKVLLKNWGLPALFIHNHMDITDPRPHLDCILGSSVETSPCRVLKALALTWTVKLQFQVDSGAPYRGEVNRKDVRFQ